MLYLLQQPAIFRFTDFLFFSIRDRHLLLLFKIMQTLLHILPVRHVRHRMAAFRLPSDLLEVDHPICCSLDQRLVMRDEQYRVLPLVDQALHEL